MKVPDRFTRILWIELIGFDNTKPDFGVNAFLNKTGFIPDIVSLFLWTSEFVLSHKTDGSDAVLTDEMSSYGARPENEERKRQTWTKFQLKGLIAMLQAKDIQVYFCVFDHVMPENWYCRKQLPKPERWLDRHPELIYVSAMNTASDYLCPLKRLADGSLYEDFFVMKLEEVLTDYGFDGFHAGDGYAHPRYPVWTADFSDDMAGQFSAAMNISVPALPVPERANWILSRHQAEWTKFLSLRHLQFWRKALAVLRQLNRQLIFNTAWARDPFEAYYRYGVDYRGLFELGVTRFLVEAPAAVVEMEGWNRSKVHTLDQYRAALLMLKARNPEAEFFFINHIKDGNEGYNVLRHATPGMISDIYGMAELFYRGSSSFTRCASGLTVCLADGIRQEEWHMLDGYWASAFQGTPEEGSGITLVWSDAAFETELAGYGHEKYAPSFLLLCALLAAGLPVNSVVGIENAEQAGTPLLVLNPGNFPGKELNRLKGTVYRIGRSEKNHFTGTWQHGAATEILQETPPDRRELPPDPESWLLELPCLLPPSEFFVSAAAWIKNEMLEIVPCGNIRIPYSYFQLKDGSATLLIRNDSSVYEQISFCLKRRKADIINVTDIFNPYRMEGSREGGNTIFHAKLPPLATTVIQLDFVRELPMPCLN
jgi:hypothetical protein